jgi:hypothetical protein
MKKTLSALLVAGALLMGSNASAGTITFELDDPFGTDTPSGVLTATFEDVLGGVLLTMDATALTLTEYVKEWAFNFSGDVSALNVAYDSGVEAQAVVKGADAIDLVEPASNFDFGFSFLTGPASKRFGPTPVAGDPALSVYLLTSASPLAASMFNVQNPTKPTFFTVAKVNSVGLDGEGSAKQGDSDSSDNEDEDPTPVPEPSSAAAAIFGLGAIGLAGRLRRK